MITKILSGGQTGADQGALHAARAAGIATGGFVPKGWLTEDGPAPWLKDYSLVQHEEADFAARTKANVAIATAVLWFGSVSSPGALLTLSSAGKAKIKTLTVSSVTKPEAVVKWLREKVFPDEQEEIWLMVAGNRESSHPGIGAKTEAFLKEVFALLTASETA